ncbi:MAG: peptidase T [Clostridia bacterium]|nr:peptidase T [Clostridia bacterium]
MKAYERLLKYVKFGTPSDDGSETVPSTQCQFELARAVVEELKALGAEDAFVDGKCYVYGHIPATVGYEDKNAVGFIAHLDTAPDFEGVGCEPRIIESYDGCDIPLGNSGRVIKTKDFPHLKGLVGKTLIVTDGTTLLGADDKAGIADIMTAIERIRDSGVPHGRICIAFTPDEEIGRGADCFDLDVFGADWAYTVDGSGAGEIEYENFNAASAVWTVNGVNVHPGSAKDVMVNASLVAMEINSMLPAGDTPANTECYEGFFHLCEMTGTVESARLEYIVRDHSAAMFDCRLAALRHIEKLINAKYGEGTARVEIKEQYRNMAEKILPCFHIIEDAKAVTESLGIAPAVHPIRGGTDGARLSYMGLPCPNLGTGGYAFHGPYEHAVCEEMEQCVDIIVGIVKRAAEK